MEYGKIVCWKAGLGHPAGLGVGSVEHVEFAFVTTYVMPHCILLYFVHN